MGAAECRANLCTLSAENCSGMRQVSLYPPGLGRLGKSSDGLKPQQFYFVDYDLLLGWLL